MLPLSLVEGQGGVKAGGVIRVDRLIPYLLYF